MTGFFSSTSLSTLLQTPPATGRGVLIGADDWRLSVEVLLPEDPTALWGVGKWGSAKWNRKVWHDLTPYVRGLEWTRGADEYLGRPRVGEATITLDNNDNRWSPWNPTPPVGTAAFFAPGTVVRAGIRSATDTRAGGWIPQFTVIADSWRELLVGAGADRFVELVGFETLRDLATIDDNELDSLEGSGENAEDRIIRLLGHSGWRYGFTNNAINTDGVITPLQSTAMSANRLGECYQTADSGDATFRSGRRGDAFMYALDYIPTEADDEDVWPLFAFSKTDEFNERPAVQFGTDVSDTGTTMQLAYDADSVDVVNEDEHIVNDARFARVGGFQQVWDQPASIARFGRRTLVRSDLLCTTDERVQQIASYVTERRALNTLRVRAMDVASSDRGDLYYLVALAVDIGVYAYFYPPSTFSPQPSITGFVENMTHRVTPRSAGGVTWSTRFGLGTRTVNNLPAAQLPARQFVGG